MSYRERKNREEAEQKEIKMWLDNKSLLNKILSEYEDQLNKLTPQDRLIKIGRIKGKSGWNPSIVNNPHKIKKKDNKEKLKREQEARDAMMFDKPNKSCSHCGYYSNTVKKATCWRCGKLCKKN